MRPGARARVRVLDREACPGAGVHGEHDRHLGRERPQRPGRDGEQRPVHERGAVQRHEHVPADPQAVARGRVLRLDAASHRHQRVDHRVSDMVDVQLVPPLREQVLARLGRVREEDVRHRVGQHAVDLLGHRAVEGAQPGLDVGDGLSELAGDERGGKRRVHIARHQHHVGPLGEQDRLQALHRARGLQGVRTRAHAEAMVGLGDSQLREEHLGHRLVVVLAGVHEHVHELLPAALQRRDDRRDLHEVRPRAHDREDLSR